MAKFCTECGKEIAADVTFCTECGAKTPSDSAPRTVQTTNEVKTEVMVDPPAHTASAQSYQQPVVTQAAPQVQESISKVVGTGAYFDLMLLFALPIIGIISVIVLPCKAKNKNIKNFAKANLIWAIIAFIFFVATIIGIIAVGNSLMEYIKQALEGSLGDLPIN